MGKEINAISEAQTILIWTYVAWLKSYVKKPKTSLAPLDSFKFFVEDSLEA